MKTKGTESKNLGINPHAYKHQSFDKGARNVKWKNESVFNLLIYFHRHLTPLKRQFYEDTFLQFVAEAKPRSRGQDMLPPSSASLALSGY